MTQFRAHGLRLARLVERRMQPHGRLLGADLLQRSELHVRPRGDRTAVQHQLRLERSRSTASVSRASSIVSEIRKKPSPFGPYAPPGETTTADSSSTISQYDADVWPWG